jgi:hypothetical protein
VAEAVVVALAEEPLVAACNAAVDPVEVACSEEAEAAALVVVDRAVACSTAVAVDLVGAFHHKARPAKCTAKARQWGRTVAEV